MKECPKCGELNGDQNERSYKCSEYLGKSAVKKKILGLLVLLCLCVTGCSEKKNNENPDTVHEEVGVEKEQENVEASDNENEEAIAEQRLKNQEEITSIIVDIITVQLPENIVKAGGTQLPDLNVSSARADDGIFNVSYETRTGTSLNFTYDLDSKEFKMLSLSAENDIESYTELLASVIYLSDFGFTEQEIGSIASMVSDEIYELEIGEYKINQVTFPTVMFTITKK